MRKSPVKLSGYNLSYESVLDSFDFRTVDMGRAELFSEWKSGRIAVSHPFFRIYYLTRGRFGLIYPSGRVELCPGNLYLIPAFYPFSYDPVDTNDHYFVHFTSVYLSMKTPFQTPLAISTDEIPDIGERFMAFFDFAKTLRPELVSLFEHRTRFLRLLLPFLTKIEAMKSGSCMLNEEVFERIVAYIDRHLDRDIPVGELQELSGLKRAVFSAEFRLLTGLPPKRYLCMRRLNKAKLLLRFSSAPVAEIAREVGFRDELFFFRSFKKNTGITPTEYRLHTYS